jgi:hypothetical protein
MAVTAHINFTMKIHRRTEKAALASSDGDEKNARWLPLSQIKIEMIDEKEQTAEISVPTWLAEKNSMI